MNDRLAWEVTLTFDLLGRLRPGLVREQGALGNWDQAVWPRWGGAYNRAALRKIPPSSGR